MITIYYPDEELKKNLLKITEKHLGGTDYKLFIFGSRVTGKGSDRSDIDIGIESSSLIPLSNLIKVKEELDNLPTLYKFDVVDFAQVTDKFRKVAMEHVEYLN